jgi:hypothetical protein
VAEGGRFSLSRDIEGISDAMVALAARFLEQTNASAGLEERQIPTDDREDVPAGELLLADHVKGKGRLYEIDSRGFECEIEARFAAIGLADVAAYALLLPFSDEDLAVMSTDEATLLAFGMIHDVMDLSSEVGPPIHLWVLDDSGPRAVLPSKDRGIEERLEAAWASFSAACKGHFLDTARRMGAVTVTE